MSSGISIMDLGLNEFRLDLLEFIKNQPEVESAPHGMNAIVKATEEYPKGVIYVLRNIKNEINIDKQNRLHPFYMVYLSDEGDVVIDHLSPKEMLDAFRFLCKGHQSPDSDLCRSVNEETKDRRDMQKYSKLLGDSISSIISRKEESDIDSLFKAGGTSALSTKISGLDDFELITFLVIR